jgi:hypothetical protein
VTATETYPHLEAREPEARAIEAEMAEACGTINAATARLVSLVAKAVDTGAIQGTGTCSAEQWVTWKCGLSRGRAHRVVTMARRFAELAHTASAFEKGQLSEDQAFLIFKHAPAHVDEEMAAFAREASVSQLGRVLSRYQWAHKAKDDQDQARPPEEPEARRVSFGSTEEGNWRLSALLPADEGALVERALDTARRGLAEDDPTRHPSWADALVAMADRSLGQAASSRPHCDRHLVVMHLRADQDGTLANLHLGPALPDALRRLIGCDARLRPLAEVAGVSLSVGRAQRIVADRTRMAVEDRDGGCRAPGCGATRWLQVHHVIHWEDGGPTDTDNLVALCSRHHRLHHLGLLGIEGDADRPDGLVFTDAKGRRLTGCGRPAPPGEVTIVGDWVHPSGERMDTRCVYFNEAQPV